MGSILAMLLPLLQQFMMTPSGISLIASILPKALDAFASINNKITEAKGRGLGHEEAVQEAAKHAADLLAKALAAEQQAIKDHAAHPADDGGFDPGVFRD